MTTWDAAAHADLDRWRNAGGTVLVTALTQLATLDAALAEVPGITRQSLARSSSAWTAPSSRSIHAVSPVGGFVPSADVEVVGWALLDPVTGDPWYAGRCVPFTARTGQAFGFAVETLTISVPR